MVRKLRREGEMGEGSVRQAQICMHYSLQRPYRRPVARSCHFNRNEQSVSAQMCTPLLKYVKETDLNCQFQTGQI